MPPKGFGLRWTMVGHRNTRNGPRILWAAPWTTVFKLIWENQRSRAYDLGYGAGFDGQVAFWEVEGSDHSGARAKQIDAVRLTRERRRKWRLQTRDHRMEMKARREAAVAGLRRIMSERRWAIHHSYVEDAVRFSNAVDIADGDLSRVEKIVQNTDKTVATARRSLETTPPADDRTFCESQEVRGAVTKALRHITGNDEDWAAIVNDIGWSKATTVIGHVLAMEDDLSVEFAAHAMRILRVHHKQVPPDLGGMLNIG